MQNKRTQLPYRCQLFGGLGSIIALYGLLSDSAFRVPFPLLPQPWGIPVAVVGFLVIALSGWCVFSNLRRMNLEERTEPQGPHSE